MVWNDNGYRKPSGGPFTSGYPAENGFGHEEWNNSKRFEFSEGNERFRIFHTEGMGNQPLDAHAGRIVVFLVASHQGKQYLVSVGGQATGLFNDENERRRLANKLDLRDLWEDVWALPFVKSEHENAANFRQYWKEQYSWLPTWVCPASSYLALNKPLLLSPEELTGRKRLISMYNSYQEIDRTVALKILDLIPTSESRSVVLSLKAICGDDGSDVHDDILDLETRGGIAETTKKALIDARLGQGRFRAELIRRWHRKCAVTGCTIVEILRASHVKPWRLSTDKERLDSENGLLLCAHVDALFDSGLVSFADDGALLISAEITIEDRSRLRLEHGLTEQPSTALKAFLAYHRRYIARSIET